MSGGEEGEPSATEDGFGASEDNPQDPERGRPKPVVVVVEPETPGNVGTIAR
ncbi:MAG: RNA methyltransferase, partial [Halorubrum sp.]